MRNVKGLTVGSTGVKVLGWSGAPTAFVVALT